MKSVKSLVPGLILLITLSGKAFAEEFTETERTFPIKHGGALSMNVNPGEIKIIPWSRDEVKVTMPMADRDELQNVKFFADRNSLKIEYSSDWGEDEGIIFTVYVPEVFNLDLLTKVGEVYVKGNMAGTMNIKSYAGDISIMNVKGATTLSTNGGEIKTGDIKGDLNINTMGGDIVTGQLTGQFVKISTMGGDINIQNSTAAVKIKTMGGDITTGTLGGGSDLVTYGGTITTGKVSGNVKLDTYGGDLILAGAEGTVTAKSLGGNITLRNVKGNIVAKTYAGDIIAELHPKEGSSSDISTNSGSIQLFLPENANARISAKAKVPRHERLENEAAIISDFKETIYNTKSRYTEAEYLINYGNSIIDLTTSDDGIRIFKIKTK
jgi:DUF4097 and DUF4098 domain-containing protein YvlB